MSAPERSSATAPPGFDLPTALSCLFLSALLLISLHIGLQRPWTPGEYRFDGDALQLLRGHGETEAGSLIAHADTQGLIVVRAPGVDLPASRVTRIEWRLDGLDADRMPQLLWATDDDPGRTHAHPLPLHEGRHQVATSELEPWQGKIVGLALLIEQQPHSSIRIDAVRLHTAAPGIVAPLRTLWQDWTAFEGFQLYSINTIVGSGRQVPVTPVIGAMLWIGLALLLWYATRWWRGRRPGLSAAVLFFLCGWLVLDARWLWDLYRQLQLSQTLYAGKTAVEKRLAEPSHAGASYRFALAIQDALESDPSPRIFIISEDRYWRYRLNYFLLPNNSAVARPGPGRLRSGDILVVHDDRRIVGQRTADPDRIRVMLDGDRPLGTGRILVETADGFAVRLD